MLLNSLYCENKCHQLQLASLMLLEKTSKMDNVSLQQMINRIPLLKYRYRGSFPSDYVPTLDNDTFAFLNTQPSNMQGEHWMMIANSCQNLYFADSLGHKKYSFLKQQIENDARTLTVPSQHLWFLHDICSFSSLQIPTRRNYRSSRC